MESQSDKVPHREDHDLAHSAWAAQLKGGTTFSTGPIRDRKLHDESTTNQDGKARRKQRRATLGKSYVAMYPDLLDAENSEDAEAVSSNHGTLIDQDGTLPVYIREAYGKRKTRALKTFKEGHEARQACTPCRKAGYACVVVNATCAFCHSMKEAQRKSYQDLCADGHFKCNCEKSDWLTKAERGGAEHGDSDEQTALDVPSYHDSNSLEDTLGSSGLHAGVLIDSARQLNADTNAIDVIADDRTPPASRPDSPDLGKLLSSQATPMTNTAYSCKACRDCKVICRPVDPSTICHNCRRTSQHCSRVKRKRSVTENDELMSSAARSIWPAASSKNRERTEIQGQSQQDIDRRAQASQRQAATFEMEENLVHVSFAFQVAQSDGKTSKRHYASLMNVGFARFFDKAQECYQRDAFAGLSNFAAVELTLEEETSSSVFVEWRDVACLGPALKRVIGETAGRVTIIVDCI